MRKGIITFPHKDLPMFEHAWQCASDSVRAVCTAGLGGLWWKLARTTFQVVSGPAMHTIAADTM